MSKETKVDTATISPPWKDFKSVYKDLVQVDSLDAFLVQAKLNGLTFIRFSETREKRGFGLASQWLFFEAFPWITPSNENGQSTRSTTMADWDELDELETNSLIFPLINVDVTCNDDKPFALSKNFSADGHTFTLSKKSKGATAQLQASVERDYIGAFTSMIKKVYLMDGEPITDEAFTKLPDDGGIGFYGATACYQRFVQSMSGKSLMRSPLSNSSSGRDGQ